MTLDVLPAGYVALGAGLVGFLLTDHIGLRYPIAAAAATAPSSTGACLAAAAFAAEVEANRWIGLA